MGKKLETHFDNLDKFYTECEVQEDTGSPDKYKEISRVDDPKWVGLTKEEIQKSKYFYKEGLDKLEKLDEDLIFGGSKTNYKYDLSKDYRLLGKDKELEEIKTENLLNYM